MNDIIEAHDLWLTQFEDEYCETIDEINDKLSLEEDEWDRRNDR